VAIFYLFGFRPVTDYVHLTPLLSLSGIPLLILITAIPTIKQYNNSFKKLFPMLFTSCFLLLTAIGLWSSLFFGYYRWSPPLIRQNTFVTNPRVNIWTDEGTQQQIQTVTNLLNKYSKPNEEVFLNYYAPMAYFISDKRNPTRYDYTGLPKEYQSDIIQTLEQKEIRTVLSFYLNKNDKSIIGEYIRSNYRMVERTAEYEVWGRRQ
jgi:hypothetical protein